MQIMTIIIEYVDPLNLDLESDFFIILSSEVCQVPHEASYVSIKLIT